MHNNISHLSMQFSHTHVHTHTHTVIDFSSTEIVVTIPAGSLTVDVVMPIVDDEIHEEPEEGFLALLRLEQANFPDLIDTTTGNLTLGRISDNDGELQ